MHLANGDHTLRYGGVAQEKTEVKVNSNGTMDVNENGAYANGHTQTNGHSTEASNEVEITSLKDQPLDAVLDTVLTAWTILVQRYQRDVFHRFSWGIKGAGSDKRQCIETGDLNLLTHSNAASLATKIQGARLKDVSLDRATIFLNDGTKEEVRKQAFVHCSTTNCPIVDLRSICRVRKELFRSHIKMAATNYVSASGCGRAALFLFNH